MGREGVKANSAKFIISTVYFFDSFPKLHVTEDNAVKLIATLHCAVSVSKSGYCIGAKMIKD